MAGLKKGFTLVEFILVVVFLAILAIISVPRLNLAVISKHKAEVTAKKIVTDLRRTRGLAISDAANNTDGFELKMVGNPITGYEIMNTDTRVIVDTQTIDSGISVSCPGSDKFKFGPLGNLRSGSGDELIVSAEGKIFTITIIQATGMVKCVEN